MLPDLILISNIFVNYIINTFNMYVDYINSITEIESRNYIV